MPLTAEVGGHFSLVYSSAASPSKEFIGEYCSDSVAPMQRVDAWNVMEASLPRAEARQVRRAVASARSRLQG
jgi:hypothetical protein